jgi:outer membrane receptor protein involved in Fe transport
MHIAARLTPLYLLAAAPAAAQQAAAPEVVVTGRGLPDTPGERAFDVVTIDRARLEANAANRLESVLAEVAGLQQFRRSDARSANPTSQGVTLRGLGGNAASRALLLLDGVPQADPFGGWVAFPAYAPDRLARVRVTRGGGSGYQGPGALAGTIELESAGATDLPGLSGRLDYGSRDSLDASAAALLDRPGGFATLSASYARGSGFIPIVAERRGLADRPAPYEQASGAVRAVLDLGSAELQANASAFTDRRERGTAFTTNRSEGADASLRLVGRGRWGWSALAYVQTRDFASQFAGVDAGRTAATLTLDQYATPAVGRGLRLEVQPPLGGGATLRLGGDRARRGGADGGAVQFRRRPADPTPRGGRAQRHPRPVRRRGMGSGALTMTAGGRVDRWRIAEGRLSERLLTGAPLTDTRYPDRTGTEWSGRAGLAWRPVPPVSVRAAAYAGWRLPTLNELYRPFRVGPMRRRRTPASRPSGWKAGRLAWSSRPQRAFGSQRPSSTTGWRARSPT